MHGKRASSNASHHAKVRGNAERHDRRGLHGGRRHAEGQYVLSRTARDGSLNVHAQITARFRGLEEGARPRPQLGRRLPRSRFIKQMPCGPLATRCRGQGDCVHAATASTPAHTYVAQCSLCLTSSHQCTVPSDSRRSGIKSCFARCRSPPKVTRRKAADEDAC